MREYVEWIKKWLRYARRHPWQAVGILFACGIPIVIAHLFLRQIEVWEDAFLEVHGSKWTAVALAGIIDFLARHPFGSIGILALAVVMGPLIHGYVATHPFFGFEKQTAASDVVVQQLPEFRPRVAPHGYGSFSGQQGHGLIVTNPGYPAFNVHIPSVTLGVSQYRLVFPLRMAQLLERDHKCFFPAYLEHPTLPGHSGSDLFEVMRANNIERFNLAIVYQDGEFRWYRSGCVIERNVQISGGGIGVTFVEQRQLPKYDEAELPSCGHPTSESNAINGELYRLAVCPRTMAWELVKSAFHVQGCPDDASVDCDVLLEMYLVSGSLTDKFIRGVLLSANIGGSRAEFEMQHDLRAMDMNNHKYEYAIESKDFYEDEKPMDQLLPKVPFALMPEQPIQGWVRFFARDINPDKIDRNSWQIVVVDSIGTEYPITKVSDKKHIGEVGLRRLGG